MFEKTVEELNQPSKPTELPLETQTKFATMTVHNFHDTLAQNPFQITGGSFREFDKSKFIFSTSNFTIQPTQTALNYRQTFSGSHKTDPQKRVKLKSKRSYLPLPPAMQTNQSDVFFTSNGFFSTISKSSANSNSSSASSSQHSSQNKILTNEYQRNAYLKSDSFMSGSDSSSSNYETDGHINPPYIKYKKPPTYEESLKKIVSSKHIFWMSLLDLFDLLFFNLFFK